MRYRAWEAKEIKTLEEMLKKNRSVEEIKKKLGRSELSILNQAKKIKGGVEFREPSTEKESAIETSQKTRRTHIEKAAVNFLDIRVDHKDYKNVWPAILDFQNVLEEKSIEQNEATIKIRTKGWVGIAFVGDLHIGNMATDYKTMLYHRDLIAKAKNLYVALNGDYCDNYLPSSHIAGMFEALFPPAVQKNLAKDYIETIKDKTLALVAGCHDLWGLKASDWDLTEYLAKHGEAIYLGSGGVLWLKLGKQTYKIMMRHKYRFNSIDNPTFTVKKMFEKCGGFDVGVVSHHHTASMEEINKEGLDGNLKRIFLRAGTYKIHDRYAKQEGFVEGSISVPLVLFNSKERDLRGFQDLKEGIEYLNYLNRGD